MTLPSLFSTKRKRDFSSRLKRTEVRCVCVVRELLCMAECGLVRPPHPWAHVSPAPDLPHSCATFPTVHAWTCFSSMHPSHSFAPQPLRASCDTAARPLSFKIQHVSQRKENVLSRKSAGSAYVQNIFRARCGIMLSSSPPQI